MKIEVKLALLLLGLIFIFYLLNFFNFTGLAIINANIANAPRFTIFYPKTDLNISFQNITFAGTLENADAVYTKLNNDAQEITLPSGSTWTKLFTLVEGKNTVSLYVCKSENCSESKTININYTKIVIVNQINQSVTSNLTSNINSSISDLNQNNNEIMDNENVTSNITTEQIIINNEEKETRKDQKIIILIANFLKKLLFIS